MWFFENSNKLYRAAAKKWLGVKDKDLDNENEY
jgi:hypothetical protein